MNGRLLLWGIGTVAVAAIGFGLVLGGVPFLPGLGILKDTTGVAANCALLCRITPDSVPPECNCVFGITGGGGSSSAGDPLSYDAILQSMEAARRTRMANVQSYWLIERSNIAPIPTVRAYERNSDGRYEYIPTHELSRRQVLADPNMPAEAKAVADDPAAFVRGLATALDLIGQAASTEAAKGEIPGAAGAIAAGIAGHVANEARKIAGDLDGSKQEKPTMDPVEEMVQALRLALDSPSDPVDVRSTGCYYIPDGSTRAERFQYSVDESYWNKTASTEPDANGTRRVWDTATRYRDVMPCQVWRWRGRRPYEGSDGIAYTIESFEHVTALISKLEAWGMRPDVWVDVYVRVEATGVTAAGFQRFVVHRETDRYAHSGPMFIARRVRESVSGISQALPEVEKAVEVGGVNELPSQAKIREVTGSKLGVPGARPTVSKEP